MTSPFAPFSSSVTRRVRLAIRAYADRRSVSSLIRIHAGARAPGPGWDSGSLPRFAAWLLLRSRESDSDLPRNAARQGEEDAHHLVPAIGGRLKHARAAAVDDRDATLAAVGCRRRRDAPASGAPMHPDVLDPELGALAHGLVGDLRARSDHDRVDAARDRAQVVVGRVGLDLLGVRVDREDLVATLLQALVHDVAAVASRRPGDAGDGHSLVTQEFRCSFFDR